MNSDTYGCGHPRTEENSTKMGKRADGTQRFICKICHKANVKRWQAEHPEQVKKLYRDWYQRQLDTDAEAHRAKVRAKVAAHRARKRTTS